MYEPSDDSFFLLKEVLNYKARRFLEVGCGSGLISLSYAEKYSDADVWCCDIDEASILYVERKAKEKNLTNLYVVKSDLFENISGKFDIIAFNPPYLPTDKGYADLEDDGVIWRFLSEFPNYLERNGKMFIIMSSITPEFEEKRTFLHSNFRVIEKHLPLFFETLYLFIVSPRNTL